MELKREQAIEILERFDFFQGQRAGRELWNGKPFDVQEQDIANFSRDVGLLKNYINKLTEENERLRAENKALVNDNAELQNRIQEENSEEDLNLYDEFTKLLTEGIKEAKVNNASEFKTRFAVRFGTYTDKDMTPIAEVFRLLDQIAKEMLEGENEN